MNKQIQDYLERARNLNQRIELALENKRNLFMELTECSYNLQRVRIAVSYQKRDSGLTSEDLHAMDEIIEIAKNAEKIAKDMNRKIGIFE